MSEPSKVVARRRHKFEFLLTAIAAAVALGVGGGPARAADETPYYHFKSILSTPDASWCIEVPGGKYEAGAPVLIGPCTGPCEASANQTFVDSNGNITIGGYCLSALATGGLGLAECNGSDQQVWELKPQTNNVGYQINNAANMCVTIEGQVGPGAPLVLAQCQDLEPQGWELDVPACRPKYGAFSEPVYYWHSGHRTCW